jgi:hypothetical protein
MDIPYVLVITVHLTNLKIGFNNDSVGGLFENDETF